jgi:hypothetical protein
LYLLSSHGCRGMGSPLDASSESNARFAPPILRLFGIPYEIPSSARSYQALTFYPALAYWLNIDGIDEPNFRIIGVGNRGLSGIVYRIKVACGRSKQNRHNAWGGRFGKIADPEFHARKIKRQPPISNGKSTAYA